MKNLIRITDKNLVNGYWAENKNGYQILDPSISNDIVLYCKILNGKVVGAVEVKEDIVTGDEKILSMFGNYNLVKKKFMIN